MSMTKGRDITMKDKSSRPPLLSRKTEIGQQRRSPNPPSILERKKALASTECKKVPIYYKPTVCSILYAQNSIKHPFFDKTKPVPQCKLISENNVSSSYIKTVDLTKPKDVGKTRCPLKLNDVSGKKQTRQPTKELENKKVVVQKKPRLDHLEDDKTLSIARKDILASVDHNKQHLDHIDGDILTNEVENEDGGRSPRYEPLVPISVGEDQDMVELDTCFDQDNVTLDDNIDIKDIDDHGGKINQQDDQVGESFDGSSDQETREPENKQVVQEADLGSKDEEMEQKELGDEEPKPKEVEIKEGGKEVPKEEEHEPEVSAESRKVVAHGKKDTAAYNYVTEEITISKLREQRRNRVKALVGAFESVISLESHVLQK